MAKRYPKSEVIKDATTENPEAYVTWGEDLASKQEALHKSSESLDEYQGIQKAEGSRRFRLDYSNLDGNTGGRPGLTRSDYYYFRPDEEIPTQVKNVIKKAEDVYQRVGLVKNVIDLMADFAVQGIRPVHKNKRIERFYRQWFKKVDGKERSERFLNNLYKTGNLVINRQTAKLSIKIADSLYRAVSSPDLIVQDLDQPKVEKREVPWKYTFIDPYYVDVSGGSLASFVTKKNLFTNLASRSKKNDK